MSTTVVLKSTSGAFQVQRGLPNGQMLVVKFEKKNDFQATVPTFVEYQDPFEKNKVKKTDDNWAQHLLDHYDNLELVGVKEEKVVEQPVIVDKKKKKKEKSNEEVAV